MFYAIAAQGWLFFWIYVVDFKKPCLEKKKYCCSSAKTVQNASLVLQGVDNVHGSNSFSLGMLRVSWINVYRTFDVCVCVCVHFQSSLFAIQTVGNFSTLNKATPACFLLHCFLLVCHKLKKNLYSCSWLHSIRASELRYLVNGSWCTSKIFLFDCRWNDLSPSVFICGSWG